MAYRFKLSERWDTGFQRIATEQIERAIGSLDAAVASPAVSVHAARKCLKRARALLRFYRSELGEEAFKSLNIALRDVGRALSGARDLDVLQVTTSATVDLNAATRVRLGAAIRQAGHAIQANSSGPPIDHAVLIGRLRAVRDQLDDVAPALARLDAQALPTLGFARTYVACQSAFSRAFASDDDHEAMHDWRKAVQVHWRHMQLLEAAWPAYCAARIEEARLISTLTGDARDLALLQAFAEAQALPRTVTADVTRCVRARVPVLRAEAKLRGERLLADGVKGLHRRFAGYWTTARHLAHIKSAAKAP